MELKYDKVKQDFLSGRLKGCRVFFEENKFYVEAGYCYIILDKLEKAQEMFNLVKDYDVRAKWGLLLIQMIKEDINTFPTYFQIRNFLELDLNILILYCKGNYVEKIIRYADFMAYYNPECYKFIGRAFWANNLIPAALFFLRKAKDKFYQDPELHYLLAYIFYHNEKNIEQCRKSLNTCLEILPDYAPAKRLKHML
ncbi:MAG: hypothetical protein K2F57_04370 [Candidatus Gastranaerophilales bacterium]|nr:hypothetical protein [Candidatus Gastranaerophilales bacterium]